MPVSTTIKTLLLHRAMRHYPAVAGRAHHIRLPHLDSAGDSAPGSIVELRRFEDAAGRSQQAIAVRSDLSIGHQVKAQGTTWLDRQLVAKEPVALSERGFGGEVREAMNARVDHLVAERLARRQDQRVVFARDLLDTLRRRELETAQGTSRRRPASRTNQRQKAST